MILCGRHFFALYGNALLGTSDREAVGYTFKTCASLVLAGWCVKITFTGGPIAGFSSLKMEFRKVEMKIP